MLGLTGRLLVVTASTDGLDVVLSVRAASFEVEDVVPYSSHRTASLGQAQHAQGMCSEEPGPTPLEFPAPYPWWRCLPRPPRWAYVGGAALLATGGAGW